MWLWMIARNVGHLLFDAWFVPKQNNLFDNVQRPSMNWPFSLQMKNKMKISMFFSENASFEFEWIEIKMKVMLMFFSKNVSCHYKWIKIKMKVVSMFLYENASCHYEWIEIKMKVVLMFFL
jgi:hypothetical protein